MDDHKDLLNIQGDGRQSIDDDRNGESQKKKIKPNSSSKPKATILKRPQGGLEEVGRLIADKAKRFNELYAPKFSSKDSGYQQKKFKPPNLPTKKWCRVPFDNPAREDGLKLEHWQCEDKAVKEYSFPKYNQKSQVLEYTDEEYTSHLESQAWTHAETDHLLVLCKQFDLRFFVIHDRWDSESYGPRVMEDLQARYYEIFNILQKVRASTDDEAPEQCHFDANWEKRRKTLQETILILTQEKMEMKEENFLRGLRKRNEDMTKERETKIQNLTAAAVEVTKPKEDLFVPPCARGKMSLEKKETSANLSDPTLMSAKKAGVKFQTTSSETSGGDETKASSYQPVNWLEFNHEAFSWGELMRYPADIGKKKVDAIESILKKLQVDIRMDVGAEETAEAYNKLRSEIALLFDLKSTLVSSEMKETAGAGRKQEELQQKNDAVGLAGKGDPKTVESASPSLTSCFSKAELDLVLPDCDPNIIKKQMEILKQVLK